MVAAGGPSARDGKPGVDGVSDFTIQEVLGEERFSIEGKGDFVAYTVSFDGEQGRGIAQHKRKANSPAPAAGETIDAEIVQKNGKTELKRIWTGAPSNGGGKNFQRDPKDTAQIVRQHSQHMAMLHVASMERRGKLPDSWDLEALRKVIDWYQADAEKAQPMGNA